MFTAMIALAGCRERREVTYINAARPNLDPVQGGEQAATASAPNVPPPIARSYSTRVTLDVEIKEHVKTLSDGVTYTYWTFGDETPGKFIRVREGDLVETRLSNHPDNTLAHNIDFHGATGPGGGGEASFVAPGHSATFTWRAMRPGLFLYHCVAAPAGLHIASGMYGLILVEPKQGLPKVDREIYIAQGEFYTSGKYGERGPQRFSMDKALKEQPEYVVFNGQVGALMGEHALQAKVGESVRIYLGNAGPSLTSSFHIVGEIFDNVYGEGGILPNQHNVQTTVVPVGGSAMVEFTLDVPGDYTLVDHSMFRAFNKGAMGMLRVTGPDNDQIFTGRTSEGVYRPETHLEQLAKLDLGPAAGPGSNLTQSEMMAMGAQVFSSVCFACHQSEGQGLKGVFPPLAKSDFLMADKDRAIGIVMNGFKGEVVVNGETYRSEMPKPQLTDVQIASVLTYVRSSFGNSGEPVTLDDVNRVRAGGAAPSGGPQRVAQALPIKAKNVALRARPKSATPRTTR
jgi:nitrite reductase (NO-forming)